MRLISALASVPLVLAATAGIPGAAYAVCSFTDDGATLTLQSDCTIDATILVPDGYTLDGNGYAITAVDPAGGHFEGAVVQNDGAHADVMNLTVSANGLANTCDPASPVDTRLRGILFKGASGSILRNTVQNINQGASGCQEGNAIEVRNFGDTPDVESVTIAQNMVGDYQKTGIACNGDVRCDIRHNVIGDSATQQNLAANAVQIGFGAFGNVELNHINGNQWLGASNYTATAVLLYTPAPGTTVRHNNIGGNADVGVFIYGDDVAVDNNRVFDGGEDGNQTRYDIGIGNYGVGNSVTNNKVRGFATPVEGDAAGTKVNPSPHDNEVCFGADCGGA